MPLQSQGDSNGVYYFLGNITSHILHALPLYEKLGGTFVVTSNKARKVVEQLYDVPVINIDNRPYKWMKPGRRPKPIHEYIIFDKKLKKTYDYLNKHAKVVLFYELFELEKPEWLTNPRKIFLTHGNMLKSYMTMYPKRLEIIKDYDYMAALGPHMKQQFISDGVSPDQLLDIGIARTDEVVKNQGKVVIAPSIKELITTDHTDKPLVSYMPTFWGASSIYETGLEIIKYFPDEYILLFRPHPQTPAKLLKEYEELIQSKPNIIYLREGQHKNISLINIFDASSVIIGDVSSVMLEALLTRKPLLFAHNKDEHGVTDKQAHRSIKSVVDRSPIITPHNVKDLKNVLDEVTSTGVDSGIWQECIDYNFFYSDGDSIHSIVAAIREALGT